MTPPRVSIIVRSYNSGGTIKRALNSLWYQSLPLSQFEVIVVDDGSTDNTLDSIAVHQLPLTLITPGHLGAIKALNKGLHMAKGKYYTILDADDELPSSALTELLTMIEQQPELVAVYGNYREFWPGQFPFYVSTQENIFSTIAGGIIFKRQLVVDVGGYDETLFFPEYDLLIKLLAHHQLAHLDSLVYHYYRHSASLTANASEVEKGLAQLEKKYGRTFPIRNYHFSPIN